MKQSHALLLERLKSSFRFNPYVLGAFVVISFFFITFPHTDIKTASLFYNEVDGFFIKDNALVRFFYYSVTISTYIIIAILFGTLGVRFLFKKAIGDRVKIRMVIYLMLCLALGPGLVVNTIFKNNWDRARPVSLVEFGGEKKFSPPLYISDQCETNCSFVSGHASMGFYFMSFAFLLRGRQRKLAIAGSVTLGALIGIARMAQGGHFLSDVIFCGFFVYFTSQYLYNFMYSASRTSGIVTLR